MKKQTEEIIVYLNFANGTRSKLTMPDFKSVKHALCKSDIEVYGNWIRTDAEYSPTRGFLITGLHLNRKTKKVEEITLTEQRIGGFNE